MNIFNLSFGKDSMATLILAIENNIPIDRVMYCDIKFSPDMSGKHPIMAAWIPTVEKRLHELFGITVEHAYSGISFCEQFYTKKKRIGTKHYGEIYGFPYLISAWCNRVLKTDAIAHYLHQFGKQPITQFVGIAYDEPKRWLRMNSKETELRKYRSLLVEQKLTEQDTFSICQNYRLLSPLYDFDGIYRGGCWFCPKQSIADLYSLWKNYLDLYSTLLSMENDSRTTFKPNQNLYLLKKRFENGYIPRRTKLSPLIKSKKQNNEVLSPIFLPFQAGSLAQRSRKSRGKIIAENTKIPDRKAKSVFMK